MVRYAARHSATVTGGFYLMALRNTGLTNRFGLSRVTIGHLTQGRNLHQSMFTVTKTTNSGVGPVGVTEARYDPLSRAPSVTAVGAPWTVTDPPNPGANDYVVRSGVHAQSFFDWDAEPGREVWSQAGFQQGGFLLGYGFTLPGPALPLSLSGSMEWIE